jgi:RHS repeat-associated protein
VGHQITGPDGAQYDYDPVDMMTALDGATRHEVYIYDANDQRIATVVSPATAPVWRYTLRDAGANVIREWTSSGLGSTASWSWTKDYVHRNGALLASVGDAGGAELRVHFHLDHLQTPRLLTDDEARKVSMHTYWPFGLEAEGSDRDTERMKYTGHERDFGGADGLSDLDYMHARYYSAAAGRFLSTDPELDIAGVRDEPQRWNRYSYVENNPLNRTDPDGKNPLAIALSALVNVSYESIRQIRSNEPVNNKRLFAALGAGALSGAIGPIGGGLRGVLAGGAVAGVANGAIQRFAAGEKTTAKNVAIDAASGAAGRGAGRYLGKAMVDASRNVGKLNTLVWQAAVERWEASAANTGLGADKLTQQEIAKLTEGITRTGAAIGVVIGKETKAQIKEIVDEIKK